MSSHQNTQTMKPATAAKKLGVYLPATPAEFREGLVTRGELNALQTDPPEWLQDLRRDGPHPRPVVAAKLGVSISGLARGGVTEALTTEQIDALKEQNPDWLQQERATQADVRKEAARLKAKRAEQRRSPRRRDPPLTHLWWFPLYLVGTAAAARPPEVHPEPRAPHKDPGTSFRGPCAVRQGDLRSAHARGTFGRLTRRWHAPDPSVVRTIRNQRPHM